MIIKKRKTIDTWILFSKIVKSVMNFPKHTCAEIYGAFQQKWCWLKCRFIGVWLHMPVERLSPEAGSVPAFHSVQQNINSLLKYFPYAWSICICLYLRMIKWRCALPQKNLNEGISAAYAYLFIFPVVVIKSGAWNIKKLMLREGVWGQSSQKQPENFVARKGKENLICDPSSPPPPFGVEFISRPPKMAQPPPPPQLINNDRTLIRLLIWIKQGRYTSTQPIPVLGWVRVPS